jgi:asparaginyl-tRNA synthetase
MNKNAFTINNVATYVGQTVELKGWIFNLRSSGKILFLIVRDGTGFMQCVVSKAEVGDEVFDLGKSLRQESSVIIKGTIRAESRSPLGFEMDVKSLELVHLSDEFPIALKEHGVGFLMEKRHLWIRSPKQNALLRIRAVVEQGIRDFLNQQGFVLIDSPILTGSAAEGSSTLFELDYFGEKAYLSQTGQLYQEAAAMAFGKVYCFGPTFRAEKSKTRRHLTEFWMVEPEMAYVEYEENLAIQENLVYYLIQRVLKECSKELHTLERDLSKLESIQLPFPRVRYEAMLEFLNTHQRDKKWGDDITGLDETIISSHYQQPVFITHFPVENTPFYMLPDTTDTRVVLAADLMAPEGYGEIIGGSQRVHDMDQLLARIHEAGLSEETYEWYLDLRKYGSVPHSGFGMGLERFVGWMAGIDHIREAAPFPRTIEKIYP